MAKRQASEADNERSSKRSKQADFRNGLFDAKQLQQYTTAYASSQPYRHGVIDGLIDDELLRSVRNEIQENIEFTPKETDIYKIHQSGDLSNLDGLDDASLKKLPSLKRLRDALYSAEFRQYLSTITDSGPLSGKKTDMAVNVYTPGCHLLCHDDVIGSRRVSYILYLTDPDKPWQPEWGGALRLYPVDPLQQGDEKADVPRADPTVSIPPAFNQLSFFAVQPGRSFHDVEEVYFSTDDTDDQRVRMAISGWFHIPQPGEDGYEKGLAEKMAHLSSLSQLQGHSSSFDLPLVSTSTDAANDATNDADGDTTKELDDDFEPPQLTEDDLTTLIDFMNPQYLTPDAVEELSEQFVEESCLSLGSFLHPKIVALLQTELDKEDWQKARPPYKQRFVYTTESKLALGRLIAGVQSEAFLKWLQLVTSLELSACQALARRFRRGMDYTLASRYASSNPQLEACFGLSAAFEDTEEDHGGYEMYMAGDDDDQDAAVYRATDEDSTLFVAQPSWNTLTLVLRDQGTLKFVKYLSHKAPGDRYDVVAAWSCS